MKRDFDKYILLNIRKIVILIAAWFVCVILHNAVYRLLYNYYSANNSDEAFFFIIAMIVIPAYAIISLIYTIIKKLNKKNKKV